MRENIEDMIANPDNYGFQWGEGSVSAKVGGDLVVVCENAPHMEHTDTARCMEVFGDGYFLDMANGTSGRVRDQEVTRSACKNDLPMRSNITELKRMVLERALNITRKRGTRTTIVEKIVEKIVETRIYIASDGAEFTDKAELMAHEVDIKLAAQ